MSPEYRTLVISTLVSATLWLLGGFVVGHGLGIIFTTVGIAITGYAVGNVMNSPVPEHK